MHTMGRLFAVMAVAAAVWTLAGAGRAVVAQDASPAMTLRMIVVTTADAAQRVLGRLKAGENFAVVARGESTAPSAEDGGWLGKLPLAQLRPEVRRALDGLAPGRFTDVIRIPTGFAIFKVEADEPAAVVAPGVSAALAASGAVRYVYDVSGFTEARAAFASVSKAPDWNMESSSICSARNTSLAATRASIEAYLAPANQAARAARPPIDLMQLYFGLGQLDAYEGKMAGAVAQFERAYQVALAGVPSGVLQLLEALGIAHLHKSSGDNGIYETPGDFCLLPMRPGRAYAKTGDSQRAVDYFLRYLEQKPEDLEVRWLLNLAYMTLGQYPDKVPAPYLIPPSAFASTEDVGRFRDVAADAGIHNFEMAGGLVVEDLARTGRLDVVTSTMDSCGPMKYFRNNGDGTFSDRTEASGLARQLGGLNLVPGDYDNDGCRDILLLRGGWEYLPQRKSLLRNDCHGTFTDVTAAAGLTVPTTSQTAVWSDINNDGFLDLFVGNETGAAQLFLNKRDGTFEDIAASAGVNRSSFAKGVTAGDYDNDGWPDLYVSNYGETNFLYHNNHNNTFTEFAAVAGVRGTPTGFATWFFDYDNDGWEDIFATSYVASIDEMVRDYLGTPHNATTARLYRNLHDGTFRDVSAEVGLDKVMMPMGSNFGDIDNDGWLDMYLGTGQPSYVAMAGAVLLRNDEGRAFVNVTASSGTGELHKGHSVSLADLDDDGDEDILFEVGGATRGDRHAMRVFENPGHGNDWIDLALKGVTSNKTAVGARIAVTVEDAAGRRRSIHRTVGATSSFGSSPLTQHVGLGRAAKTVDLEIWWPTSHTRQRFTDVGKNRVLTIEELAKTFTASTPRAMTLGGARKTP
jgi:tetratricopeptide (TPR) repeat protein